MNTNKIKLQEEHRFYKCHFCQQNIDVYGIEKHFVTFHNFKNSFENEYICEFCDDDVDKIEVFNSQTDLLDHIQITHNSEEEKIQPEVDSLEEGKLKFLQWIVNFKSQEDVFNLLYWIKCSDTNIFVTENKLPTLDENSIVEDAKKIIMNEDGSKLQDDDEIFEENADQSKELAGSNSVANIILGDKVQILQEEECNRIFSRHLIIILYYKHPQTFFGFYLVCQSP